MLKAIIQNKDKTALLEFPLSHRQMANQLSHIGIQSPAHKVLCSDDDDNEIRVKIFGDSEFENRVAASIAPHNTLSSVNSFWELYQNMPIHAKESVSEKFSESDDQRLETLGQLILQNRTSTILEKYYCPLTVNVFARNDYGDFNEDPIEYGGEYAAEIEDKIRDLIAREDRDIDDDLADYFDGSNSAVGKLSSVKFSTQHVSGIVYGCIRVELTEKFTPEEEAEFKDWLEGQCSDGYGEGLEQRPIDVDGDEAYVSFWNPDDYFLLNEEEFDDYLVQKHSMEDLT